MRIGVPKEIKNHEYRVGLVPAGVRELVADGHEVIVQSRAGAGIGVDDAAYQAPAQRSSRLPLKCLPLRISSSKSKSRNLPSARCCVEVRRSSPICISQLILSRQRL